MSYESLTRSGFADENWPDAMVYYIRHPRNRRQYFQRIMLPYPEPPRVEQIAATDNLLRVFYDLKARGGQGPGPDGFTYSDWSRREVAAILRQLSAAIIAGNYRPGPCRLVSRPKGNGRFRTLRLANLCDRVVATALHQAMEQVWEPIFLHHSMGFRPRRGVLRLLAELERVMIVQNRWVLAVDDVAKAFDNVPIDDVILDHARYLTDPSLLSLIKAVLQGSDAERRKKGIDQGSAYSPTALNVRLHHAHDLGVEQGHHPFWYRYADNVVYICQNVPEGEQMLIKARQLLEQAGLTLKGEDGPPVDLRQGAVTQLLGFALYHKDDALQLGLGRKAWTKLEQGLLETHKSIDPKNTAKAVVRGWIASHGPTFESLQDDTLGRILNTAIRLGFREIGSRQTMAGWCQESWRNWIILREKVSRSARTSR